MAIKRTPKQKAEPFFWVKGNQTVRPVSIHMPQDPESREDIEVPPKPPAQKRQAAGDTKHAGLQPGWTRASFIIREDSLNTIKALAIWERKGIKDILDETILAYLETKKTELEDIKKAGEETPTFKS
jgi:hypothetical protein